MQLHTLKLEQVVDGRTEVLFVTVIEQQGQCLLIDCGYPGAEPRLEAALQAKGLALQGVTKLLLTHHDLDHVGSAAALKAMHPHWLVYAPLAEAAFINGSRKALRLQQAEDLLPCLPEAYRPAALAFQEALMAVQPVAVDVVIDPTNSHVFGPDVTVVHTPGHTPGHVSVYLPKLQTLIAADALVVQDGKLDIANPQFCMDLPQALASVRRLANLPLQRIVCYHGGIVEENITEQFTQLLQRYA